MLDLVGSVHRSIHKNCYPVSADLIGILDSGISVIGNHTCGCGLKQRTCTHERYMDTANRKGPMPTASFESESFRLRREEHHEPFPNDASAIRIPPQFLFLRLGPFSLASTRSLVVVNCRLKFDNTFVKHNITKVSYIKHNHPNPKSRASILKIKHQYSPPRPLVVHPLHPSS